ncbi:MAG: SEC-C domain-containing protein [Planctomycetia bacterium]|nr:SEC-C domain-containing protein [Planctomycetia bacterium]
MAGEIDVYQLCPCGSGRKLKFCCHAIVTEMVKVSELQESHQHQAALTLLDAIEKKVQSRDVWSRAWVRTSRAFLKFALEDVAAARQLVSEVLEELPEHPLAVAVNAILAVSADGYPACMRALYRAMEFSTRTQRFLMSQLCVAVAHHMLSKGHLLGCGMHLGLAVTFDSESEEAVGEYREFLRDPRISYPLRDSYTLRKVSEDDPLRPLFEEAHLLAARARYSDAAKAFGKAARQDPKRVAAWWNIAVCHAWAAEDPLAVEAFKAAAANEPDFESAVDCLMLSRILKGPAASVKVPNLIADYNVEAVSKLLTVLDARPTLIRVEFDAEDPELGDIKPAAVYRILDRDPASVANADLCPENIAHIVGEVIIFDREEGGAAAKAAITVYGAQRLELARAEFTAAAGDLAKPQGDTREHGFLSSEHLPLIQDWHFPADLPLARLNDLRRAYARRVVDEVWPTVAQEALGGKTPLEAAQSPELKMALAASVVELDVFCEKNSIPFDPAAVRARLGLPAVVPTDPSSDPLFSGRSASLLALRHCAIQKLSDADLALTAEHAMVIGHSGLCCALLTEALDRPSLHGKFDVPRTCMFLSRIFARRLEIDSALQWAARGKEAAIAQKLPLNEVALWEIHELMLRSQHADDPRVAEIASRLWNYYVPKLPEVRDMIAGILEELALPGLWNDPVQPIGAGQPLASSAVGGQGLWTPESEQPAGQPSKLWLPGQE